MVDILVSPKRETVKRETRRPVPWTVIFALAFAFVVYDTGYWSKFFPSVVVPRGPLKEVVIIKCDIMSHEQTIVANSAVIDGVLDDLKIRKVCIFPESEITDAEPFIRDAVNIGKGQAPCVVWCKKDGRMDITPLPDSIDEMERQIREQL